MPRKLTANLTLDALEDEILYTIAALQADPDATDLVSSTETWQAKIDEVRTKDRACRQQAANTTASRVVANQRLDLECLAFGRDLLHAVQNDRGSTRWKQFFAVAPHRFTDLPLSDQLTTVRGWLSSGEDSVLEAHREALAQWCATTDAALVATRALASLRAQVWQAREALAAALTAARDALHRTLAERAAARGLPRDWPDLFFAVETRPKKTAGSSETGAEAAGSEASSSPA